MTAKQHQHEHRVEQRVPCLNPRGLWGPCPPEGPAFWRKVKLMGYITYLRKSKTEHKASVKTQTQLPGAVQVFLEGSLTQETQKPLGTGPERCQETCDSFSSCPVISLSPLLSQLRRRS